MEIEEYFAQAVDRLLTGESIDDILVSYPPSVRGELRSLLVVVEAAERMATVTVPAPASLNRVSARLLFAQRAAELRGDLVAVSAAAPTAALRSTSTATSDKPTLWQRLRDGWDAIRPPAPLLRLAPLTSVLIIAFLLTFTVVVSAQESLPGDQIYGLKEWMFNQRLATAPPELLATERDIIAKEQVDDVGKTAAELNSRPEASAAEAVGTFQYRGEDADFLYFGDLLVTKGYRTDVNDPDSWTPMSGNGELQPGVIVMLRYQIVPGPMGVVEGISYVVMQEPPQPTPEPTPMPTPVRSVGCQRTEPRGWTAYSLGLNETLQDLSARSNVSSEELRKVNCLTNGPVSPGTTIFVPARIAAPPRPLQPVISATPVPTATSLPPTAGPTITPTSSAGSTATEPATTELPDATATEISGQTPGSESTASATPTGAVATPTDEATPLATKTPAAPESATPADGTDTPGTGTATPAQSTGTPAASPTAGAETGTPATETPTTGTAAPESSTTPSATASPTGAIPATPTTAPTGVSPAATAVSSPQATATPTAGASSSATPAATATSAPAATATATAAATATSASSAATTAPTATKIASPTATEVTNSASGAAVATSTATVAATPTSPPPTATQAPPPTATKAPPPPTATPPPPTATPPPPPPTATPSTETSTTDGGESP
ncbi:MAG TPA: hypothetical protein P5333_02795 [Caldilinea sp.]|nr:hypothetical protein [Caldilinea sp.]